MMAGWPRAYMNTRPNTTKEEILARTNRQKFRYEILWAARWAFMDAWAKANPRPEPPTLNLPDAPEKPEILGEYGRSASGDKPYIWDEPSEVRIEFVRQSVIYSKAYRKWQEKCDRIRDKHDYHHGYDRYLAESDKWWSDRRIAWQQSPERKQALIEEQGLPRRKNPWGDDWHLSKPEGARRPATVRLSREYMRTHEEMQAYLDGEKDPICLDCGEDLRGAEFMVCNECEARAEADEYWDDPYDEPWWLWVDEASDMDTRAILEVMSGPIAFAPRTEEEARLLLT